MKKKKVCDKHMATHCLLSQHYLFASLLGCVNVFFLYVFVRLLDIFPHVVPYLTILSFFQQAYTGTA